MNENEIKSVFRDHWRPGFGSITAEEMAWIDLLIAKHTPLSFVEVGMASGLSGGLIARSMEGHGGRAFYTLDHDNKFFGDPSMPNGFLIDAIYSGEQVTVHKLPFHTSMDLANIGATFDMAFVDANHQHPWPLIDTLLLAPYMTGPKVIVHHDLDLHSRQSPPVYGIGPKYLFDAWPSHLREISTANRGNIFALYFDDLSSDDLATIAMNALTRPWSLRTPLSDHYVDRIAKLLDQNYKIGRAFHESVVMNNFALAPI